MHKHDPGQRKRAKPVAPRAKEEKGERIIGCFPTSLLLFFYSFFFSDEAHSSFIINMKRVK